MVDFLKTFRPILYSYFTLRKKILRYYEQKHWKEVPYPKLNSIKKITGTFIYPLPPDYPGIKTHLWDSQGWENEFERLIELGINTVILNGSVAETTSGSWFILYSMSKKSRKKFSAMEGRLGQPIIKKNCLETIIHAAEQTDMKIHIGLFNVLGQWYGNPTNDFLNDVIEQEIAVAEDLVSLYADSKVIDGWYISPEISYFLHGRKRNLDMREFLHPIGRFLRKNTPSLHIGLSPGTTNLPFTQQKVKQFWVNVLYNSHVDLFYPQDSVGWLNVFPFQSAQVWKLYREIADALNLTLWANCETFEWNNFGKKHPFIAAPFERLLWQLESVSPFVDKIITWEALYFLNPTGAINSKELWKNYRNYFLNNM